VTTTQDWQIRMVENAAKRLTIAVSSVSQHAAAIAEAGLVIGETLKAGKKILVAGNGGSAACAQHFAAEFTGKLCLDRDPLPAVALTVDTSALTAIANDWSYDDVFARQVRAHGKPGDVFVGMSTSGTSKNVKLAVEAAEAAGLTTIVLTGPRNGLGGDHSVAVQVRETARIQEVHDLILHGFAQVAERVVFDTLGDDASADRFPFELCVADLSAFRAWCTYSGQTLVTTNGAFDILHEGHRSSLEQARRHGDQLVVLVNSDESVARLKGPSRPVQKQDLRIRELRRSGVVDHVVLMEQDSPVKLLTELRPDVHCKGQEYAVRPMPEREVVEACGGRVELLRLEEGISTSALVDQINAR
jgi:rfaE bifunctional protein nucleotidyltransferase chain/domain